MYHKNSYKKLNTKTVPKNQVHVKQEMSTPTMYAAVHPVAQGLRRRQ